MSADSPSEHGAIVEVCKHDPANGGIGWCSDEFCVYFHGPNIAEKDVAKLQEAAIHYKKQCYQANVRLLSAHDQIRQQQHEISALRSQLLNAQAQSRFEQQQTQKARVLQQPDRGFGALIQESKRFSNRLEPYRYK